MNSLISAQENLKWMWLELADLCVICMSKDSLRLLQTSEVVNISVPLLLTTSDVVCNNALLCRWDCFTPRKLFIFNQIVMYSDMPKINHPWLDSRCLKQLRLMTHKQPDFLLGSGGINTLLANIFAETAKWCFLAYLHFRFVCSKYFFSSQFYITNLNYSAFSLVFKNYACN